MFVSFAVPPFLALYMRGLYVLMVPEQAVLLLADLDGAATELRNEDLVAGLDAHGYPLAVLVLEAGTDGEDLGLVKLLDGAVGEEDAGGGLGLGLHALHQNAIEEGCEGLDVLEHGLMQVSKAADSGGGSGCGGGCTIVAGGDGDVGTGEKEIEKLVVSVSMEMREVVWRVEVEMAVRCDY